MNEVRDSGNTHFFRQEESFLNNSDTHRALGIAWAFVPLNPGPFHSGEFLPYLRTS